MNQDGDQCKLCRPFSMICIESDEELSEIHYTFHHYRCETFAHFVSQRLATCDSSKVEVTSLSNHSTDLHYQLKSESSTSNASINRLSTSSTLVVKHCKSKAEHKSLNDFYSFCRKITCLKRIYSFRSRFNCLDITKHKRLEKRRPVGRKQSSEGLVQESTTLHKIAGTSSKPKSITKSDIVHCGLVPEASHSFKTSDTIPNLEEPSARHNPLQKSNVPVTTKIQISNNSSNDLRESLLELSVEAQHSQHYFTQAKTFLRPDSLSLSNYLAVQLLKSTPTGTLWTSSETEITQSSRKFAQATRSQLDFRSISDYSFGNSNSSGKSKAGHCVKADVCSLPTCMDNDNMSSKMLENPSSMVGSSKQRIPSYVSISRAISGYADYNRYSSELKRDSSLLSSLIVSNSTSPSQQHTEDQVDNFCSLPYELSQNQTSSTQIQHPKSLLHKKIESLYGESFAEDWEKSRCKSRSQCSPIDTSRSSSHLLTRDELVESDELNRSFKTFHLFGGDKVQDCKSSDITHDGNWFLMQLNRQTDLIQQQIQRCETYFQDSDIPEEAVGKIRAAIGKANLLLNKKFKQFRQLCNDSISQTDEEEFKIKSNDLRGFWDMVLIQVDDVIAIFDDLNQLSHNQWTSMDSGREISSERSRSANTRYNRTAQRAHSQSASPKQSPRRASHTASPSDSERQSRLMEIKRQGKKKARESKDDEIAIFVPMNELSK